jgi:hypothetical protein
MNMLGDVDWSAMKFGLDLISTLAVFLLFVWTVLKRKQKDNSDDIKELDLRVQKLETNQALLATHEDVTKIKSQLAALDQKLVAVDNLLQILHRHLLSHSKGD